MQYFSELDYQMMARAIYLAKRGRWTTPPNPNVGCVITQHGQIIGEGWHERAGQEHAEIKAMADARARGHGLKGSTCYVTLEPCCHSGRTPPCSQALINAGVSIVVMAMCDPNPKVLGGGKIFLEKSGVQVYSGLLEAQSKQLNRGFLSRMHRGRPYIRLKIACSLDGRTALANGVSRWITGPQARSDVQRERAQSHAIISTATTVITDQASLNVRLGELGTLEQRLSGKDLRQPIRVVIDRCQQLNGNEHIFKLPGKIIRVIDRPASHAVGETLIVPACEQWLLAMLSTLAELETNDLWVEAGATFSGALLSAQLVDELIIYKAGLTLGDAARGMMALGELTHLNQAQHWQLVDLRRIGSDVKLNYRLQKSD